jgi:hypothetical protein
LDDASAALHNASRINAIGGSSPGALPFAGRAAPPYPQTVVSWLPVNRARRLARWALALFCVLGLFQLLLLIGVVLTPERLRGALTLSVRDQPVGDFGKIIFLLTWGLNAVVATLAGIAWWALRPRRLRRRIALGCGYGAMLLMLLLGNLLSSYVYQFAILVEVALQVITLGLLLRWDQATRPAPAG